MVNNSGNNIINLTGYHGQDTQHIVVPNLNDFNNAGVNVDNKEAVGVTSTVLHDALRHTSDPTKSYSTIAISKTKGLLNDKVVATNDDWSGAFDSKGIIYTDDKLVGPFVLTKEDHFQLTDVDLSNLDTSKIINMMAMFNYQHHLKSINGLSNWNVSNVKNMSSMFSSDPELKHLNLNNWDTSNVKDMSFMFSSSNLVIPESIENWDTGNVINMEGMFSGNATLQSLNLDDWDTSNVTNMALMFQNDTALKTVNLNNWDTHNVTNMEGMFSGTPSLTDLNLSNWDTSSLTNIEDMFFLSNIKMFHVRNSQHHFNNQVRLTDVNGLMGLPGSTIALIHTPTFYKVEADKSETQIVNEIVGKLVYETAEKQYQIFYKNLDKGTQLIYPTKINLKLINPKVILNPSDAANAELTYDMKIGKLKEAVINYVDENNKIIQTDHLTGVVGKALPIELSIPKGYQLDENGEKVPTSLIIKEGKLQIITVNVKKTPITKTGSINYVDLTGKLLKTDIVSGKIGDNVKININLPDGYELANKDEQLPTTVPVTENGIQTVIVNVKKIPVTVSGHINYIDPDGKVVKTDQVSGKVGDKVDVKLSLPDGYELANKDEQVPSTITVGDDGIGTINVNVKKINTTLANNEVPYDSTTISNNVNANYGYLDSYKLTENNQGQAQLIASGWHATGASNSDRYRYMIVFDNTLGHEIARQKLVPQVRSDVQRAYSNVDNSLYSGFNVTIDIPNSCINHSLRLVSRYSNDPNNGEGARVDYWFNSLALNEDNQAYLDKPSSNGNTLTVNGWHASNQAAGRPYHYIIAWDRNLGHEIARQKVTAVSRPDVANVYNTVANAVNSGFSVNFNLTPQFFNDNIQFISRWTDDAAGNGNAVDYWFKPINRANRSNLDSVTLSNGQLQVAGWHATDLSQLEPNHYLIVFDNTTGQQVASEKVGLQSSQDVKNVFGDIQTANHSRFNYAFNSLHLISGHNYSLVSRYSADANGNGNNGAHTDSWLNMGTFQQSAYSIDNVVQNDRHLTVQGWLANDYAMTKPYAYAILIQNGQEIGRQRLNLSERDDVAKVYPQIYRSQYSGFNANFDLPTLSTAGLQLVLRFTDDPAGNGNSSDQWIKLNKFSLAD
ncbi:BspA family leucine-rich repeat surface protein [Limosilactobacillus reuteri]|uniref:BspA family leucine-rich repeat surface protein n=1 Tax=Limosilactobacillus reuteri TaxID=1598 RepID=UPI002AAA83A6|nr:BspA family leucine-rich repeat surface protein [Limosilactobacillus reuteri]WPU43632.1 BspA family leucine-rich repeat surface protein [Limosilactobacillus reuteri]